MPIATMKMLLLALRYFASASIMTSVGDFGGVSKSTVCNIIKEVSAAIAGLSRVFIVMPANKKEIQETQKRFYSIAHFPKVIGAIDCTHVKIISPG